jgi:hypothetical protein
LETPQDPTSCILHDAPSTLKDRLSLPLRRWQRKEKSCTANLNLIEEGDPEAVTTAAMETAIEPPGQGRRSLPKEKEKDQPYLLSQGRAISVTEDCPITEAEEQKSTGDECRR